MNSQDPLRQRLTAIMNSWPIPIDPNCQQELQRLINQAETNVRVAGLSSNRRKVNEAISNFEKLLAEMTWEAGQRGLKKLHEPTLFAALSRICPLFPFC